jgi:hypothetical protein
VGKLSRQDTPETLGWVIPLMEVIKVSCGK